jgi:hypothetical protein
MKAGRATVIRRTDAAQAYAHNCHADQGEAKQPMALLLGAMLGHLIASTALTLDVFTDNALLSTPSWIQLIWIPFRLVCRNGLGHALSPLRRHRCGMRNFTTNRETVHHPRGRCFVQSAHPDFLGGNNLICDQIHRCILIRDSPVFAGLFALPQAPDSIVEGSCDDLPIYLGGDDEGSFRSLFRYLYAPSVVNSSDNVYTLSLG